jgi:hypothetical protein
LSPVWGPLGRGEPSKEENADDVEVDCSDGDEIDGDEVASDDDDEAVGMDSDMEDEVSESEVAGASMEAMVESELTEDLRSEWAMVYFEVVISSSRGVRKETLFSAGKSGRVGAILRGSMFRAGLFERMEARL